MSTSELTGEEIVAVATTLALVAKNPPKVEGWNRPGESTLLSTLTSWYKEQLG